MKYAEFIKGYSLTPNQKWVLEALTELGKEASCETLVDVSIDMWKLNGNVTIVSFYRLEKKGLIARKYATSTDTLVGQFNHLGIVSGRIVDGRFGVVPTGDPRSKIQWVSRFRKTK